MDFPFQFLWNNCCTVVYCLPSMILKCVSGVYINGLVVVLGYEPYKPE